jgi:hypothetical protein
MRFLGPIRGFAVALALLSAATAEDKKAPQTIVLGADPNAKDDQNPRTHVALSNQSISKQTRMQLIRLVNAEFVFVRQPFPNGEKGLVLKANGDFTPSRNELRLMAASKGLAARPGERVQISSIEFKDKTILFDINGGGIKKQKWYQRIQISGAGGTTPIADQPDPLAKGSHLVLEFEHKVPEMTLEDLKELLKPVFDFTVKSAAQAYTESLPKNVQKAIGDHKVLVGMNKEMVEYAKGRPPQRVREKDEHGIDYEEWIYGVSPQDVEFVRFSGDEVTQLKIMKIDGEKIVKTEKEVHLDEPTVASNGAPAAVIAAPAPAQQSSKEMSRPSMRRPGEAPPTTTPQDDVGLPPLPRDSNPKDSGGNGPK